MHVADRHKARAAKLARLKSGGRPRLLEICSGAGGLSLGLHAAGFELAAHVELDPEAARSYALNFGGARKRDDPWCLPRDMEICSAGDLTSQLGLGRTAAAFDVLAAGLPCQAFARIGRSKLREVAGKEDAFQQDPRAVLYRRFLQYVEDTQPLAILIENVPDILNFGGHNVPEEICEGLEAAGYRTGYTLLNAAWYGVPQVRERLFLMAVAEEVGTMPVFPAPTSYLELPRGYADSRRVALKHVGPDHHRFHPIQMPAETLPPAVSVREALQDLPAIYEHLSDPSIIRRRRLQDRVAYGSPANVPAGYAKLMRNWPGFETREDSCGHLVRLTPRDFRIFRAMQHGEDYPKARALAESLLQAHIRSAGLKGLDPASQDYLDLREAMVPPYDPSKFPNKWWKMVPDLPSRTLTAHMGKDTYSHIHYDSDQARTVSVREAARLQSFPDGFQFAGAMNAAFKQIGNAVPPLLALAVGKALRAQLSPAALASPAASGRKAA